MRDVGWLGICAAVLLNGWTPLAKAQTCETSSDCGKGFACAAASASDCPAVACAKDADCPASPCEATVYRSCQPVPCTSDSDCADGMVCPAVAVGDCTTSALPPCPPGADCPTAPTTCEDATRTCTARYLLPCQQASDCGPTGWECKATTSCACAGGTSAAGSSGGSDSAGSTGGNFAPAAPTPIADAGAADSDEPAAALDAGAAPDESCECHESAEKSCQALLIPCSSQADCPAMFDCALSTTSSGTGGAAPACDGTGGSGAEACAQTGAPLPPTVSGTCYPLYANDGSATGSSEDAPSRGSTGADAGVTGAPSLPTGAGGLGGSDAGVSEADAADAGDVDPRLAMKCSVSAPGTSQGHGWLWGSALLGIVAVDLFGRRRRRR